MNRRTSALWQFTRTGVPARVDTATLEPLAPDNWLSGREELSMTRTHKLINLAGIVMPFVGLVLAVVLLWHRFVGPKELTVEAGAIAGSFGEYGLRIGGWSIKPSQLVAARDEAAVVTTEKGTKAACIRIPRAGMVAAVPGSAAGGVPAGPLFSELYYEDGAALIDPFAEVSDFCNQVKETMAK